MSCQNETYPSFHGLAYAESITHSLVWAKFTDIRDAARALRDLGSNKAQYAHAGEYHDELKRISDMPNGGSEFEGQVIAVVVTEAEALRFSEQKLRRSLLEALERFGDIMAFKTLVAEPPRLVMRIEYYDSVAARVLLCQDIEAIIPVGKKFRYLGTIG